jgi:hypothetical protein
VVVVVAMVVAVVVVTVAAVVIIIIILIITLNSIYLRANLTVQRPITKRARVEKKKNTHTHKQNTKTRQ